MSPDCSAHDEWLTMKLCMYVGYSSRCPYSRCSFGRIPLSRISLILYYLKRFLVVLTCNTLFWYFIFICVYLRSKEYLSRITVNVYGIRLIAKHIPYLAGEPFRLTLHRLLSPSAVRHSLNVFDIHGYFFLHHAFPLF